MRTPIRTRIAYGGHTASTSAEPRHVVIVGGGIAGLSAAFYLRRTATHPIPWRCTVIEASPRLGGKLLTDYHKGFTIEGGADAFLGTKPAAVNLARALRIDDRLIATDVATRRAFRRHEDGTLEVLPPSTTPPMLSFPRGVAEFPDTIAATLDKGTPVVQRLLESRVTSITPLRSGTSTTGRFVVHISNELNQTSLIAADAVILAVPAFNAAPLLYDVDQHLPSLLQAIPYDHITTISLAYHREACARALDGHGYLIPRDSGTPLTGCTWVSSKFPHRVPPGYILFRGYARANSGERPIDAATIESLMRDELARTMRVNDDPVFCRTHRWTQGLPQYGDAHDQRLMAITDRLAPFPGLILAGSAFHGVGIPDCIQSGERAARMAWAALTGQSTTLNY